MNTITLAAIRTTLTACFEAQTAATATWHDHEPADPAVPVTASLEALHQLVLAQHLMNFRLWHVEDTARRRDVDDAVIAGCKRTIDGLNQRRNDFMEKVDGCLVALLEPYLPANAADHQNTESLGMAIDRLSIMSLKIFHMHEQTVRTDVDEAHRESCRGKLAVLHEQRADLGRAVLDLVDAFAAGTKRPKLYFQFKMYNDPALNPELYGAGQGRKA